MKIKVTAFKETGKWYSQQITPVDFVTQHELIDLPKLIRQGHYQKLSPIQGGFKAGYYYQIEAIETPGWLNYLIDKTKEERYE